MQGVRYQMPAWREILIFTGFNVFPAWSMELSPVNNQGTKNASTVGCGFSELMEGSPKFFLFRNLSSLKGVRLSMCFSHKIVPLFSVLN